MMKNRQNGFQERLIQQVDAINTFKAVCSTPSLSEHKGPVPVPAAPPPLVKFRLIFDIQ